MPEQLCIGQTDKLGKDIRSFSLPAGITCICSTPVCRKLCYTRRSGFQRGSAKDAHSRNYRITKTRGFVRQMVAKVSINQKIFRIHGSGEFYSVAYVKKWIEVIKQCPNVRFYAYTRSWRRKRFRNVLRRLSKLPNMSLLWSTDRDTSRIDGPPPKVRGIRVAHMQTLQNEEIPSYADIVFRIPAIRKGYTPFIGGAYVCAKEQGPAGESDIVCSSCLLCPFPATTGAFQQVWIRNTGDPVIA